MHTLKAPISTLSALDAVAQLFKDFAIPTILFGIAAASGQIPLPPLESDQGWASTVLMLLLWCLVCDAWIFLMNHWKDLISLLTTSITSLFEGIGSALDGSAGGAIGAIVKIAAPLFVLCLLAMGATIIYAWIQSNVPSEWLTYTEIAVSITIVTVIAFTPLRMLFRDSKALINALRH